MLRRGGVQLAFYNPLRLRALKRNLQRTHRKYLLVDGDVVFVGGSGISDDFTGTAGWRDTMLEVRGPVVADWHALFARTWPDWSSRPVASAGEPCSLPNGQRGRVAWTARGSNRLEIKRVLLNRTRTARERVWLASAYFVPSRKLRRALRRAALRGVDARLLVPGPVTDHPAVRFASRRFYARLLRDGVRIFEYRDRFMHSKVALADQWSSIGSSNMDRWNLRWNLEANQEVDDAGFAAEVAQMLRTDFGRSEELDYRQWQRRSILHRLKEWLWGRVDQQLGRWLPHGPAGPGKRARKEHVDSRAAHGHVHDGNDRQGD
jgi:phosphatidylserine/phosphatidylglycerophosphate/cardiolipin synthase-like enzyme